MTDNSHLSEAVQGVHAVSVEHAAEVQSQEKAPSLLDYPATYLLVGINVFVFALMILHSPVLLLIRQHAWADAQGSVHAASVLRFLWRAINAPYDENTILRFGGSESSTVLHGQWWRLVTSTFVHVTVLHLLINMWCLWNLGFFGEPLLGKPGLLTVYVLTGAAGMMLSLAAGVFTRQAEITAGASGAVFGIAGILIVLLSNRKLSLPWDELRSLRRSVVLFAVLNLAVGVAPRLLLYLPARFLTAMHIDLSSLPQVDNMAHLGGFLSGLALGVPLFPRMTSGRSSYRARQRIVFGCAALLLCLFGYGVAAFNATPN